MKIDQLNNFNTESINDILESRFGARIDLSEETIDTLTIFQAAVKRELDDMTTSIGFNRSMQNPTFVENRLVFDLIANAIKEKKGKDHDGDGDIDSDDYMASKDKAIKKAMGNDEEDTDEGITGNVQKAIMIAKKMGGDMTGAVKEIEKIAKGLSSEPSVRGALKSANEDAKIKAIRGQKVDIEDPDKPGQTTTVDTSTTDIKRSMDNPQELEIVHKGKDMVKKGFNKGDASSPSKGIKVGQKIKTEEDDDIEDMVAPEFEEIIHMLKQGMAPEEIKKKHPGHDDTVDQVVKDLQAVTEAMNNILPEGNTLSGTEQSALRLLVGTKEFMRAKRAIEFAKAGRAIPADLVKGLKPLFDKIGTFLNAGAGAVKRFGDIEKMIGRTVKNSAYEDRLDGKLKIKESEMDKAEVTLAAKDMVDKMDGMIQDIGQIKNEELLPLVDKVRDEVGQAAADTLKSSVETALADLETALTTARSTLDNAARTVAGDPNATDDTIGDPSVDQPMPDADLGAPDMAGDDALNSLDVPDAEVGGEDPEGREKRESVQRSKYAIAESIYRSLSGKK